MPGDAEVERWPLLAGDAKSSVPPRTAGLGERPPLCGLVYDAKIPMVKNLVFSKSFRTHHETSRAPSLAGGHSSVAQSAKKAATAAVPTQLQKICIMALWFLLGITNAFPSVATRFFMINDLRADPHLQAILGVVTSFAWNLKMLTAFTSDCVPIMGYRRKPYLYFGLAIYMASYILLGSLTPSLDTTAVCLGFATLGQMTMGVMCDTLIVENVRSESDRNKGQLQTRCWVLLALGGVIGTLMGAVIVENAMSNQRLFVLNAIIKISILPFVLLLSESPVPPGSQLSFGTVVAQRAREMWGALQQDRIWQPTLFIFFFAVIPNAGAVMPVYLVVELGFSETQLSFIMVVAGVSGALGIYIYGRYFRDAHWHYFFAAVIAASSALSLTVLILVFRVNRQWGIPDLAFALGDDAIMDVTNSLLKMPILILIASICPTGVESSVYALVTSIQVAGGTVGGTISATLIEAFGITLTNFRRLWELILLCALLKLVALPLIPMLPVKFDRQRIVNGDANSASKRGAAALLALLGCGIAWSIGQAAYKIHQG